MQNNDLLLLDEPFNGLDILSVAYLSELLLDLKKQDGLIFISSHDINLLSKISDSITFIENSTARIQSDSFQEIEKQRKIKAQNKTRGIF